MSLFLGFLYAATLDAWLRDPEAPHAFARFMPILRALDAELAKGPK